MGNVLPPIPGLSRRRLLRCAPLLAAAGARLAAGRQSAEAPALHFPTEPRARLAVTSFPFRAYIDSPANRRAQAGQAVGQAAGRSADQPRMDIKDFAAMVVKRFDVHNINPLADHFSSTDAHYLESFRASVAKAGSHVVDLGLAGRNFGHPDAAVRQTSIEYGRTWIDIATVIGSPSVRQHLSTPKGMKPDLNLAADSLARLAEHGEKRTIIINLENDNAVAEDPFFLVRVIQKVNSPYLRALPDFGNSRVTYDAEKNQEAVALMLKYARNMCHVKDTVRADQGTIFNVDLGRMFALASQTSYKGYFSMEYEMDSADPFQGTNRLIETTLKYLA